jgi:hypothetical protein
MRSKFAIPALVMASFALSGTFAYAQTGPDRAAGGSAARQETGDTLVRKPTSGEKAVKDGATGVTTGTRNGVTAPAVGGPPSSQQSTGTNGG